jgi:hypothetical protein
MSVTAALNGAIDDLWVRPPVRLSDLADPV